MQCHHCNAQIPDNASFCPFCGQSIQPVSKAQPSEPSSAMPVPLRQNEPEHITAEQLPAQPSMQSVSAAEEHEADSSEVSPSNLPSVTSDAPSPEVKSTQPEVPFPLYHGGGLCDVCNRSLTDLKAYIVPNDVFYGSRQYRDYYRNMSSTVFGFTPTDQEMDALRAKDSSSGSAVCENCIHMFTEKPVSAQPAAAPQFRPVQSSMTPPVSSVSAVTQRSQPVSSVSQPIRPAAVPPASPAKPKKKTPVWLFVLIGGILFLCLISVMALTFFLVRKTAANPPTPSSTAIAATPTIAEKATETPVVAAPAEDNPALTAEDLPPVSDPEFKWPVPGDGERLYIGIADFEKTERFYVAFLVSADGTSAHNVTIRFENPDISEAEAQGTMASAVSAVTERNEQVVHDLQPNGESEISTDTMKLTHLKLDVQGGSGTIDYTWKFSGFGNNTKNLDFSFGSVKIKFINYTNAVTQ